MAKKSTESTEPRIVAAAMTASASKDRPMAQAIEDAMVQAVTDALAEGVSVYDSSELIRRKQRARGRVLRAYGRDVPDEVIAAEQ